MAEIIGLPLDRIDGRLKVTGNARYAAENRFERQANAVLVQSTIGKGRIAAIDASAAERAPGVLFVMTHLNAPRLASTEAPKAQPGEAFPLLQDDRIHYNGQHVAVVVAESFEQATYAATLLRIGYEKGTPATRLAQVSDQAAVPKNFRGGARPADSNRGTPDESFAAAPIRIDQTYTTPMEHHNPMEPHAVVAAWDQDGTLRLMHSTQAVSNSRKSVSGFLGLAPEKVHVVNPFVGGGFGSKGSTWPHVTLAAMAARVVQRPVKLVLTRRQMYSSNGFRSHTIQHVKLGADHNGKLLAIRHDGVVQTAAFGEFVEPVGLATEMLYACANVGVTHRVAPLNIGIPTFMRAPGEASGMFALESAMDELAYAARLDPVELRLRNHADSDGHENLPWSSKSLKECYERGATAFGWERRSPGIGAMKDGDILIGWGMASATYPANRSQAGALVRVFADGTALVQSGTQDIGTGTYTIMAQVTAETLGLPVHRVRAELGDSTMPAAPGSGGSQSAASVTPAVQKAAQIAREQLISLGLAQPNGILSGATPEDIDIVDGVLFVKSAPSRRIEIRRLMAAADRAVIEAKSDTKPGEEKKQYSMHAFGAHFVEVRVDPALGEVRVSRFVGAYAAGRVLNAKTARSQMLGGIIIGLGMALTEATDVDARSGRIVNASIAEYLVPVNADVPDIDVILVDEQDPHINPLGVKGMGELPMVGTAAAVANAVYHATGKRVRDLPIRLEKVMA